VTTPVPRPLLTVVCPVHNEEECVPLFYERLRTALTPLGGEIDHELLFSNNRSTDGTAARILELRARDPRVQMITWSKNVGYQASVQAALHHTRGDLVVVIDVDCEDPPEMIPRFVAEWKNGYDLVYGERRLRQEPRWLTFLRRVFYRLNHLIADSDIILDMAEFALLTAPLREAVLAQRSTFPFVRMEIAAAGFERMGIPYDRGPRVAGRTHYNIPRMITFAVAGILSSTTFPLRASLYALALVLPVNLVWLVSRALSPWFAWADLASGRGPLETVIVLDLSYLCVFLAMACLYLARTYRNGIGRPTAIVDWRQSAVNAPPPRAQRVSS
jgi:polyisoprenyl-phosphate glycosyltransferase